MPEPINTPQNDQEDEVFPVEPRYHPLHRVPRVVYDFLASAKLAMVLLIVILACCLTGVTIIRDPQAGELIFRTLWFNCLLILLVVNVGCCFFGRIWGRRITYISFGMILFHLSFIFMFLGIVYNGLFYFRGNLRLTEGETLPCADQYSYDAISKGRFFDLSKSKGTVTLVKLHTGYKAEGADKRVAYELAVGEPGLVKQDTIYVTKHLQYKGFKYFPDSEGYSILTVLFDTSGKELYGAYLPLQSLQQNDKKILYTTGSKEGPGAIQFPQYPVNPLFGVSIAYKPDSVKERAGEAFFQVLTLLGENDTQPEKLIAEGKAAIGNKYAFGDYALSVKEVRYWTAVAVRYEPGQPIILASLWVGLFGMILTTLARMFKVKKGS